MTILDVVVGGLYGSEAKGHATQRLVERHLSRNSHTLNLRIGGPNAGHTGFDKYGHPWALRQIPIGVVCDAEPGMLDLLIAPGSEIDLPVLLDEIDRTGAAGLLDGKRLFVHDEATMIEDRHKESETSLVGKIGSTGKGIGAARADRLLRGANRLIDDAEACSKLLSRGVELVDNDFLISLYMTDAIVIEGVQGYALGLRAGFYPQCTTSDCRAIDFLSMAGISPWGNLVRDVQVWVVARVFPIRVAGNSGPLKGETSWGELGLPEEHTTVTKKVRRVGEPDWHLVAEAVRANGGPSHNVRVAISMVDQMYPKVADRAWNLQDPAWVEPEQFMRSVEDKVGADIGLVMSGPNTAAFRGWSAS